MIFNRRPENLSVLIKNYEDYLEAQGYLEGRDSGSISVLLSIIIEDLKRIKKM